MARKPYVTPLWKEVTFKDEGLDARSLITRTDKKGIIVFSSTAYRKITKFDRKELLNAPHSIVRHPFMPESVFKEMWDTIKRGEHFSGIVMNLRKDGYHYWVEVHIDPVDKDGNIISKPDNITGFIALRREPTREEIQKSYELYRAMRKAELLKKKLLRNLKDWEKELLDLLPKLPKNVDDLLVK